MVKSPFFVFEDALSPNKCDLLISEFGIKPSSVFDSHQFKNERFIKDSEQSTPILNMLGRLANAIEARFGGVIKGVEIPVFQQYFENPNLPAEPHGCENSKLLRKKWVKSKDIDLVGFIWLKDYNSGVPLDSSFEVYGGKLEFPAYNFSLVPQRGTLVLYPAGPHFITAISPILVGSLEQVKITVKLTTPDGGIYLYQPSEFPGTYQEWFVSNDSQNS
ncbi:MAG: hypothetical protein DDT31_00039 [Syntrophomonadaceae bacterium]|nr:hypothetical protein [Bacillota bacterium]